MNTNLVRISHLYANICVQVSRSEGNNDINKEDEVNESVKKRNILAWKSRWHNQVQDAEYQHG